MKIEREKKCATMVCPDYARRTVAGERYCLSCAQAVEQASYMSTLPTASRDRLRYREAFIDKPPPGVTIPEPLSLPAPAGWKARR